MLAPHSLTTQVPDQRISTGQVPEWSDCEEPALVGTCDPPVIKWQVLGLPFSTAIFRTLPIEVMGFTHIAHKVDRYFNQIKKSSINYNAMRFALKDRHGVSEHALHSDT